MRLLFFLEKGKCKSDRRAKTKSLVRDKRRVVEVLKNKITVLAE